ncbi:hypothetical protein ERO13_A09G198350v2 [Gossypium hirsutum]|uniref:Prolamin-like domain-containing protein n=3 Tax=Gossypium TaxID=3633 RepID=A0A5J5UI71_GOSBA|nr:hypothetical protein ES319_A09G209500v1 [Gossypium barbadense]KAG4184881.1 hypothetical protein ERO13_A09G198350v2 [Gossypium hirsutum]TYH03608.1 hypothetical protein ES288_A09G233000v1 [Gossypium darwinii]TYI11744.1 hypothetical protein ES332_A09G228100v1 [Gossypium tomentosum]
MGYFKQQQQQQQQTLLLILALAFAIAITPALSVVGWDERHMPDPRVCWAQINKANGCEHEIYASLVKKKIKLSYGCCEAVQGMSSKCKNWMFNHGRFSPEFGDQIKGYCATLGVTLPPSYRIYYPDKTPPGHIGYGG